MKFTNKSKCDIKIFIKKYIEKIHNVKNENF